MSKYPRPQIIGFSEATALTGVPEPDTFEGDIHWLRTCDWCHCAILLSAHDEIDRLAAHTDWHVQQGHTPPSKRAPVLDQTDAAIAAREHTRRRLEGKG